jgi:transcriptional regulator with XRE-family HTH domain
VVDPTILNGLTVEGAEDSIRKFFGQRLRQARESYRRDDGSTMSQAEFAEAIQVTQATVSRWEDGLREPSLFLLSQIAIVLGADITWLIRGSTPADARIEGALRALGGRLESKMHEAVDEFIAEQKSLAT